MKIFLSMALISTLAVISTIMLSSCETAGPAEGRTVPVSQKTDCENICTRMGMKLGAFVVIANHTGCVCEPVSTTGDRMQKGASAVAGGAMISWHNYHQQQQQQNNRKR
ncbi:hypothetical protein KKF34_04025 [Myxococcota bacterium]|nr:hypothetical protein [Myxococcota bacterium]MBU1496024.1 hypothetical protein [Myxococcota bacterium]